MKTRRLVMDALCAALYVVLSSYVSLNLGPMKLSLDGLPILIGALMFGPMDGLIIGLLGNFLSQLLGSYGLSATTVLWMLPDGLRGLSVGWYAKKHGFVLKQAALGILILISSLLVTTVTTGVMWVDCQVYRYAFVTYAPYILWRYAAGFVMSAVFALVLPLLLRPLRKSLDLRSGAGNEE